MGIMIDGTATGILYKLPKFNRPSCVIHRMRGPASEQYLMLPPALRKFTDAIFKSAKKNEGRKVFEVEMNIALKKNLCTLVESFFHECPLRKEYASAYASRCLLKLCFKPVRMDDNSCGKFSLIHLIGDQSVRRSITEFGRCFVSGSISGGVLRRASCTRSGNSLVYASKNASCCSKTTRENEVCTTCLSQLKSAARESDVEIPSLSRLIYSLINAYNFGDIDGVLFRGISSTISWILDHSFSIREKFSSSFHAKRSDSAGEYTEQFMNPAAMFAQPKEDWIDEALDTGELFPGNPVMRPNVTFGRSSRTENVARCKKNYRKSDSHSPGIFTVQRVCRCPKLIGLSVMDECEIVSTAMSVLLSRFKYLPKATYYDNGYNLSKSVLIRFPWINDETIIMSDRFHYRSHKCNTVTDPDRYAICNDHRTSGTESINQQWNFSKKHIRYLSPENLMSYLAIRSVFLNIRTSIREKFEIQDIGDTHFLSLITDSWKCSCVLCIELPESSISEEQR